MNRPARDELRERNRAWRAYLRPLRPLDGRTLLEVGACSGANVPYFVDYGFRPEHITLNELRADRAAQARALFPDVRVITSDAAALTGEPYDVVVAATLFTSILDDGHRQRIADTMWHLTAVGGGVLLYDFTWDNPLNPHVRKLTVPQIRALFPKADLHVQRVTLAPPIARHTPSWLAVGLHCVPWLRTHVVAWLGKH